MSHPIDDVIDIETGVGKSGKLNRIERSNPHFDDADFIEVTSEQLAYLGLREPFDFPLDCEAIADLFAGACHVTPP